MAYINSNKSKNPWGFLITIGIAVLALVALFMIARFVFTILMYAAPILLLAALIFDYRTVVNYGKWLIDLTKRQTVLGIVAILLTVIGFPVVAAFLFGKALLRKRVKDVQKEQQQEEIQPQIGEYIDFEEVKREQRERQERQEKIELPPLRERQEKQRNEYERLFGDDD